MSEKRRRPAAGRLVALVVVTMVALLAAIGGMPADAGHRSGTIVVANRGGASLTLIDERTDPAVLTVDKDTADRVHHALQALTPEQREVIVLRVFFGLTGPETAEAMDKPIGAVRSLQNRAEARLRSMVDSGAVVL